MTFSRDWVEVIAPAKINLTLHVTGQRADGYHLLDSLVAFSSDGDILRLQSGACTSISVTGPFAEGVPTDARNLVWKAAALAGWSGQIELVKNLPHGAGIGGGSSDAAALLRAAEFNGSGLPLGADVPVCQLSHHARMSGIGDTVEALSSFPVAAAFTLLVNPGVHVPTPDVFRALAQKNNPPMDPFPPDDAGADLWLDWLKTQRNDLEAPAIKTAPIIAEVLQALKASEGCLLARMSGSGSTCFGLFANRTSLDAAKALLEQAHPDWWCCATSLN